MATTAEERAPVPVSFRATDAAFINENPVHTGERALAALTSIFVSLAETIRSSDADAADAAFQSFSDLSELAVKIYEEFAEDIAARYKDTLNVTIKAAVADVRAPIGVSPEALLSGEYAQRPDDGSGAAWNRAYGIKVEAKKAREVAAAEAAAAEAAAEAARAAESSDAAAAAEAAAAAAEAERAAEAARAEEAERAAEAARAAAAAEARAAAAAAAAERAAAAAVADTLAELKALVGSLRAEHGPLLGFKYLLSEPPVKELQVALGAADSSLTLFSLLDSFAAPSAPSAPSAPLTAESFGRTPAEQAKSLGAAVALAKGAEASLPAYAKLHVAFENIYDAYPDSDGSDWRALPTVGAVFGNVVQKFTSNIANIRDDRLKCSENAHLAVCSEMDDRAKIYGAVAAALAPASASAPALLSDVGSAIRAAKLADVTAADPAERVGEFIASHLNFMDSLFPVRTVVNFRTNFQSAADTAAAQQNMRSMLGPSAAGGDLGKFADPDSKDTQFLPISDVSDPSVKYGPFFRVITDSSALNVSKDMESMFAHYEAKGGGAGAADAEPKHYMYSGFGYSGSGKTFALLKNPSGTSVLSQIALAIQAANDSRAAEAKAPYTVKCYAYDYYGEIRDAGCEQVTSDPAIADLTKPGAIAVEDLTFFKVSKQPSGGVACTPDSQDLKADKSAETIRAVADRNAMTLSDLAEIYGKPDAEAALGALSGTITDYRARTNFAPAAGGADAPQRYHIRATPNNDESSRSHFFIDMYVTDGDALVGRATVLDMAGSEKVGTIQDDYFALVAIDATKAVSTNRQLTETIRKFIVTKLQTEIRIRSFSKLRSEPWLALRDSFLRLGAPEQSYDDLLELVLFNNAYSYAHVALQYKKVYQVYAANAATMYRQTLKPIESFTQSGQPSDYEKAAAYLKSFYTKYAQLYEAEVASATKLMSDSRYAAYVARRGEERASAELSAAADLLSAPDQSAAVVAKIARLNAIKAKYHCPIRYQGNFINASLHWLKLYVTNLANGGAQDPGQLADTFTNTLMRQNLHDPDPNKTLDRKFVLMTNIRLDFGAAGSGDDARRKNYRDAATLSLQFAHCINPFASKSPGYFDCDAPAAAPVPAPAPAPPPAPAPAARPSSAASRASSKAAPNLAQAAAEKNKADAAAAAAAAARNQKAMTKAFEKKKEDDAKAAALARIATPPALPRGSTAKTASTVAQRKRFRAGGAGAYDPTAETSLAHVQALGLVVLFALSIGLAERTTSPTRERTRPGSAPHPAVVRAGFTVAFLIFYTLTTLVWAALGVASFGAYITHLFFFYTLVGTFTGVLFKKKSPAGSILAAFVLSLTAFFADA